MNIQYGNLHIIYIYTAEIFCRLTYSQIPVFYYESRKINCTLNACPMIKELIRKMRDYMLASTLLELL